jgi:hypothetical protein
MMSLLFQLGVAVPLAALMIALALITTLISINMPLAYSIVWSLFLWSMSSWALCTGALVYVLYIWRSQ